MPEQRDQSARPSGSDRASVETWLDDHDIFSIRVESVGVDGWVFGKHVSRSKFLGSLDSGLATADLAVGFDLGGQPYFGWSNDWSGEIGDVLHRPDLATLALVPGVDGTASVMADFGRLSGEPIPVDPRSNVRLLVDALAAHGYQARVAMEIEAYVFEEDLASARALGFTGLTPLGGPRPLGYAVTRSKALAAFMHEVARRVAAMGIEWEAWSDELGPGQIEFNLAPADPVTAADNTMRTKTILREVAEDLGHCVTFLSKPLDLYGSGLHVNHSLTADGAPVFPDESAADGRSQIMRHWLGGLMASVPATVSLVCPVPTSYRRFKEIDGPPTTVTWGENNKTTAIRSITRSPKVTRLEHRLPSGDANPYIAVAAILAGGIRGLEDRLDPPPEFDGMAWALPPDSGVEALPKSIMSAAEALRSDGRFTEILGTDFVDHWLGTRHWEWLMFHTDGGDPDSDGVSEWELRRYFDWI